MTIKPRIIIKRKDTPILPTIKPKKIMIKKKPLRENEKIKKQKIIIKKKVVQAKQVRVQPVKEEPKEQLKKLVNKYLDKVKSLNLIPKLEEEGQKEINKINKDYTFKIEVRKPKKGIRSMISVIVYDKDDKYGKNIITSISTHGKEELFKKKPEEEPKEKPKKKIIKKKVVKEKKTESRQEKFNRETKDMTAGQVFSYNQSRQGIEGRDVSQKELDKAKKEQDIKLKSIFDDLKKFINDGAVYSKSKIITNKNDLEYVINTLSGEDKYINTDIYKKAVEKLKGKKAKSDKKKVVKKIKGKTKEQYINELEDRPREDMEEKKRVQEIFKEYGKFQNTKIYSFEFKEDKNSFRIGDFFLLKKMEDNKIKTLINLLIKENKKNINSYAIESIMERLVSYVDGNFSSECRKITSEYKRAAEFMEQKKKKKDLPYGEKSIKGYLEDVKKLSEIKNPSCIDKNIKNLLQKLINSVKIRKTSKKPIYNIFEIENFLKKYGNPNEYIGIPNLEQQEKAKKEFLEAYNKYYKKKKVKSSMSKLEDNISKYLSK